MKPHFTMRLPKLSMKLTTALSAILMSAVGFLALVNAQAAPKTSSGPTVACPTCQPTRAASDPVPMEYIGGNTNDVRIKSGSYYIFHSNLPLPKTTASPRIAWENTQDLGQSKWTMSLTEMFVIDQEDATPKFVDETIPSYDRSKEVAFTGSTIVYSWANVEGNKQEAAPVSSATMMIKGTPETDQKDDASKGAPALNPTIDFSVTCMAHRERTVARVRILLSGWKDENWKTFAGKDIKNPRFALVFRVNRMTQLGALTAPLKASLQTSEVTKAAPYKVLKEQVGEVKGDELTLEDGYYKIVAGGNDILIAKTATGGGGQSIPVRASLGKDRSGQNAIFIIFDKFETQIDLTAYTGLNAYAVYSWATWAAPAFATTVFCIIAALFLQ